MSGPSERWTRWNRLQRLDIVRTTGAPGTLLSRLMLRWDNTVRISVGANYKPNAAWKLRFGVKNLTDPVRGTIYDPEKTQGTIYRNEYHAGREYSLSVSATF